MDQILFAPVLNCLFFTVMTALDGKPSQIPDRIKQSLLPQLMKHWSYWPLVQLYNFNYVPPHLRVLFGNCAALFWNMYLSIRNNRKK